MRKPVPRALRPLFLFSLQAAVSESVRWLANSFLRLNGHTAPPRFG